MWRSTFTRQRPLRRYGLEHLIGLDRDATVGLDQRLYDDRLLVNRPLGSSYAPKQGRIRAFEFRRSGVQVSKQSRSARETVVRWNTQSNGP
jgi:hypothetical protein